MGTGNIDLKEFNSVKEISSISAFFHEVSTFIADLEKTLGKNNKNPKEYQAYLTHLSNQIIQRGFELTKNIEDKRVTKKIKATFRTLVGSLVYQSIIMKRGLEKPKGYPGDYEMLEFIYDNKEISEGIGHYFDRYFLSDPLAEAVRNRKDLMFKMLRKIIGASPFSDLNILNLACGSSRDILELLKGKPLQKNIAITCVDQDKEALDFSKKQISNLTSDNTKVDFIRENLANLLIPNHTNTVISQQNIIYSIGLADYLPDKFLKRLINYSYNQLLPKGTFIIAHKDYTKYLPISADWFCDWKFIKRSENDFINLIQSSEIDQYYDVEIIREDSQIIYFAILTKKG